MEQNRGFEVLSISETACCVPDPLDFGIDGFTGSIRNPVSQITDDVLEPSLQGPGDVEHRTQPTAYRPSMPPTKMLACRPYGTETAPDSITEQRFISIHSVDNRA